MSPKTRPRDLTIFAAEECFAVAMGLYPRKGNAYTMQDPEQIHYSKSFQMPARLADGLGLESALSRRNSPHDLGPPHPGYRDFGCIARIIFPLCVLCQGAVRVKDISLVSVSFREEFSKQRTSKMARLD